MSIWLQELNNIMAQEYFFFLCTYYNRPDLLDDLWVIIRNFYLKHYRVYERLLLKNIVPYCYNQVIKKSKMFNYKNNTKIRINILSFIEELKTNEYTPIKYLTL